MDLRWTSTGGPDIHPETDGHGVITGAFEDALPSQVMDRSQPSLLLAVAPWNCIDRIVI